MDYYTSTEFMYETDNVPTSAGSLIDAPYENGSERMLILLLKDGSFEISSAEDLDSDIQCYGLYTFAEFGLSDDEANSYMITHDYLNEYIENLEYYKQTIEKLKIRMKYETDTFETLLKDISINEDAKIKINSSIEQIINSYTEDLEKYNRQLNDCMETIKEIQISQTNFEEKIEKYISENGIKPTETRRTVSLFIMEKY